MKFALKKFDRSTEAIALHTLNVMGFVYVGYYPAFKWIPEDHVAVGNCEWCLGALGKHITPDYYPEFTKPYLYRNVWQTSEYPLGKRVFIKPADSHKRFNGYITNGGYKHKKRGPYWCSDVVSFVNEWRYYVANGIILCAEWYAGDEINTPEAPPLNIDVPNGWCGTLDFGTLKTGELALVEAHEPFACGWYGKGMAKDMLYAQWLTEGWKYLKGQK